jgi:hypothetical protein
VILFLIEIILNHALIAFYCKFADILVIVKKFSAAEAKHSKKTGKFYAKCLYVADKTGEVKISIAADKSNEVRRGLFLV